MGMCLLFTRGLLKTITSELLGSVGDLVKPIGWWCKAARDVLVVSLNQACVDLGYKCTITATI